MALDKRIMDEKIQYDLNRQANEEILPSQQSRITEQSQFTYSLLGKKVFEKLVKKIEVQWEKRYKMLEG